MCDADCSRCKTLLIAVLEHCEYPHNWSQPHLTPTMELLCAALVSARHTRYESPVRELLKLTLVAAKDPGIESSYHYDIEEILDKCRQMAKEESPTGLAGSTG